MVVAENIHFGQNLKNRILRHLTTINYTVIAINKGIIKFYNQYLSSLPKGGGVVGAGRGAGVGPLASEAAVSGG